jgi:hypothetical protein
MDLERTTYAGHRTTHEHSSWWVRLTLRLDTMCPLWAAQSGGWRGHQQTPTGRFTGNALGGSFDVTVP